jgi:hypothetical protein
MQGSARADRVLLWRYSITYARITISGPFSGTDTVATIDLEVSDYATLDSWKNKSLLVLDAAYTTGDMASLKNRFVLGNTEQTSSPYTKTPIGSGYRIDDGGYFVVSP